MAATDYFQTVADVDFATDAGIVLVGYMVPGLAAAAADGSLPVDVPDEAFGIAEIVGAEAVLDGDTKTLVQYGGGVYTLDALLTRFGVREAVEEMAGGFGGGI